MKILHKSCKQNFIKNIIYYKNINKKKIYKFNFLLIKLGLITF